MRIKATEIKEYRDKMYYEQKGICMLCGLKMTPKESVLDHCHRTGAIRGVLHTSCNGAEGRIQGAIFRSRAGNLPKDLVDFVKRLSVYWSKDYSKNVLHPKHLIPEEKELKRMQKYKRGLKTVQAKQRQDVKIEELKKVIKTKLKGL